MIFYTCVHLLLQAKKVYIENKTKWEKEKADLQKEVADLKDKLLEINMTSKGQLSEMKKDMDELLQVIINTVK